MNFYRESSVAISHATRWKLTRIVKALRPAQETLDVPQGLDALAEQILSDFITKRYPNLDRAWKDRQAIDERVETELNPKPKQELEPTIPF